MVKAKNEPKRDWLKDSLDRIDRENPIVATRYFVVEITPTERYERGNGHGGYDWEFTGMTENTVSPYYDKKADATKWMNAHEPDDGKTLAVRKQNKRRTVTERWW